MNLSTNAFFIHAIDKLCTICQVILKDTSESTHSIFSTLAELESPMNVLQVLQSFSNFTYYNGPQMVCTTCYDKTIEVYKFSQMCNKAFGNMQHYLKNVEAIKTIKDKTDVEVKVEEISIEPTRVIIDGRNFLEEMENEKISKVDALGMVISGTEIKIVEGMEKEEIKTTEEQIDVDVKVEEISIAHTRIIMDGRNFWEDMEISNFDEISTEEEIFKDETSYNEEIAISHTEIVTDEIHNSQRTLISKDLRLSRDGHEHQEHQPPKDHETDVLCLESQEMFNNEQQLKTHVRTSHKKKFLCNDCGKAYTTKSHLNRHSYVHTGAKPFTCLTCKRGFAAPSYLRRHMNSHNEVKLKAHKCEQCDRRFTQAGNLRTHMLIHNELKAHKCEQCDQRFTHASSLRVHMLTHNGVKAHKCEQCDRRFTHASNLRVHMDIHNGVKAHKCEQCDRRFTDPSTLRRHMAVHNGIKMHKCEQCDRRFTRAAHLRSHMKVHNP